MSETCFISYFFLLFVGFSSIVQQQMPNTSKNVTMCYYYSTSITIVLAQQSLLNRLETTLLWTRKFRSNYEFSKSNIAKKKLFRNSGCKTDGLLGQTQTHVPVIKQSWTSNADPAAHQQFQLFTTPQNGPAKYWYFVTKIVLAYCEKKMLQ